MCLRWVMQQRGAASHPRPAAFAQPAVPLNEHTWGWHKIEAGLPIGSSLTPFHSQVGVDLESLHLHSPQHPQHGFLLQQHPQQQAHGPMQHQQGQQQHQAPQGPWPTLGWQQRPPQQTAWMPVAPPAVQYSSSWGNGPSAALQPINGSEAGGSHPWSAPQQPYHQRQRHQFGSQPTAGHWGVQLRGHAAGQPLSTSVPAWGAGHPAASAHQQHFKAEPVPLMYDFSAHQPMAAAPGQLPLPSPTHGTSHGVAAPQQQQQRAHTAPPPRRTSARLPSRIDYSVFAGEATSDSEDRRSGGSGRSSPAGTPQGAGYGHGAFGGSSDSPADSGGSPAGYGPPLQHQGSGPMRPASYSAGGAGHFGGGAGTTPPRDSRAAFGGSPKSLPAGGGFLKSRSGRTVRPSGHRLRDSSPEGFPLDGRRERERSAGGAAGGPGLVLLGRPGSGTLSKRKRLVQPPAALRDGADADFNQRRKQHNPWCALHDISSSWAASVAGAS